MVIHVHRRVKNTLLFIFSILTLLTSFSLFWYIRIPKFKDETITLCNYINAANVNYEVYLKPNPVYEEKSLGEGIIYITELVDYINTSFKYEFSTDKKIDAQGEYEIIAVLSGFNDHLDGQIEDIIWEKKFLLIPKTSFVINEKNYILEKSIKINLNDYHNIARIIIEATKLDTDVKVSIYMNIQMKGSIDKIQIEEKLMPSIVVPLNTPIFQITGNLTEQKPGKIEENQRVQLPINKNQVILYGVILVILLFGIIFLIFCIKPAQDKDPLQKLIQLIFKKHGDRFIALSSDLLAENSRTLIVRSIDDLVRVSDEVNKPIMYKYNNDYKKIDKFYVTCGDEIYVLYVKDILEDYIEEVPEILRKPHFVDERNLGI